MLTKTNYSSELAFHQKRRKAFLFCMKIPTEKNLPKFFISFAVFILCAMCIEWFWIPDTQLSHMWLISMHFIFIYIFSKWRRRVRMQMNMTACRLQTTAAAVAGRTHTAQIQTGR